MRMQSTEATCGAAALSNALKSVGVVRTEDEMAILAKTTVEGTSPHGIIKALRAVGRQPAKLQERREGYAALRLIFSLNCGSPVILCVDNWEHWVAAIGVLGPLSNPRVVVVDSGSLDLVQVVDLPTLAKRWKSDHGVYYGVVV